MVGGILQKKRQHMNSETKERISSIIEQLSELRDELFNIIDAHDPLDPGYSNGLDKLFRAVAELSLTNEGHLVNGVVVKK